MQGELSSGPQKSRQRPFIQSPYRTVNEAAEFLRLSPQTLNNMRSKGTGPSYYKHGRRVLYDVDELRAWSAHYKTKHSHPFDNFE